MRTQYKESDPCPGPGRQPSEDRDSPQYVTVQINSPGPLTQHEQSLPPTTETLHGSGHVDRPTCSATQLRCPRAQPSNARRLSLISQLRESKKNLDSVWSFSLFSFWCILKKAANGTVAMLVGQILLLAFPLTMLTVGILNLHECPAGAYIPIFMLGWGAVGSLKVLLSLRVQYIIIRSRHDHGRGPRGTLTRISRVFKDVETRELSHILSAAVLAASVGLGCMTYRTYGHWTPERGAITYCKPSFYRFAFGSTTVILSTTFLCTCVVYPFTGAIVYKQLAVYQDVSDMAEFQKQTCDSPLSSPPTSQETGIRI